MTARQAGHRISGIAAQRRKRCKRPEKHRVDRRAAPKRGGAPCFRQERRLLLQAMVSGLAFVLLVTVKLLLPARVAAVNQRLTAAMERNIDMQAAFSAIGGAFSGLDTPSETVEEVFRAVFYPRQQETAEVAAYVPGKEKLALWELQKCRPAPLVTDESTDEKPLEAAPQPEAATLAYVLYSEENLPDNVQMEQALLDMAYCTPVFGTMTSGFGFREHPIEGEDRFHYGVDLAADTGTDIACFADGTVSVVGESSSYGKYCIVQHRGDYATLYAHCSRIAVSSGATVKKGQKLAEVGESGMTTGPHLHFELYRDGIYLNPIYYVQTA